jgi:hypothetical protein
MTIHDSRIHRLAALAGLGLSLAMSGCGASGDKGDTDTSTGTSAVTTGSTGSSSTPTSGSTTDSTSSTSSTPTSGSSSGAVDPSTSSSSTGAPSTGDASSSSGTTSGVDEPSLSFFVSSTGSLTANLGGLDGADTRCQTLADAVGAGGKTWHAYLSVEKGPDDQPVHAKDRIGEGPWYNAALVMVAADVADLHTKFGDHTVFLDENGAMVNGQWENSPDPNEHDILTGTNRDGTVAPGKTCADWTSEDPALFAVVGHSDGLGPNMSDADQFRPWNSVHESGGCHDTAPKGGSGRIYCFAVD